MTRVSATLSSDRERRLWLWTLAVLVAIWSTLGPARTISDWLREHNALRLTLAIALAVVLVPLAWRWLRTRPSWSEIGVVLAVAFAYWMVAVRIDSWEERTHLFEYAIVGALIHQALLERARNGRTVPRPAALAFGLTAGLGFVDELIQLFLPNRVFDWRDVFFNAFAGFMVIAARLAIPAQPRPGWRLWFLWLLASSIGWGWGTYWGWYDGTEPAFLETVPSSIWAGYLGLVTGAALTAVLQWLALRRHVRRAPLWIVATLGAVAVAGGVVAGIGAVDRDVGWIVGVLSFGPAAGLLQWGVLRQQVPAAGWWVLAGSVGWVAGLPMGDINGPPGLGGLYGAVTATALVWLLRRDPTTSSGGNHLPGLGVG